MGETVTVAARPLRQGDGAFLCSIFKDNREYYEIFFDSENRAPEWEKRVVRFLSQEGIHHYILEAVGVAVGWFSWIDNGPGERELGILVIKKEHLRHGYGTAILRQFIASCKADHVREISLNVVQSNTRAIRFYKKLGFEIVGETLVPQCNDAVELAQYKMKLELA